MKKGKYIIISFSLMILISAPLLYLYLNNQLSLASRTVTKVASVLIIGLAGCIKFLFQLKIPDTTTQYSEQCKHIIKDAFSNDKTGYRKLMKGISLFNTSQYDHAIKHLNKLQKRCATHQDTSAVLFFIARNYQEKGEVSKAIEYYEQLLKVDASNSTAWSNLGLIHYEEGRVEDAKYALHQALLYNPENAYAHSNLANVFYSNGEFEKAKNAGLKAFQSNNQLSSAARITALSYACLGDEENAKKFCKIYGTNKDNKSLIAKVEQLLQSN